MIDVSMVSADGMDRKMLLGRFMNIYAQQLPLVAVLLLSYGCMRTVSTQSDERRLKSDLAIPESAALIKLTADPSDSGTFGREGLRIYAVFQLNKDAVDDYRRSYRPDDWRALPLPSELISLKDGPAELSGITANGYYLCDIAPWEATPEPPWTPYQNNHIPNRLARYRVILLDTTTSRVHIVYKQFY